MPWRGWSNKEKTIPTAGLFGVDTYQPTSEAFGEESPRVVTKNKDLIAHILNEDQTVNFMKLIVLLEGNEIVSFLEEQRKKGKERVFYDFFDFLKQEFFWENNPIPNGIFQIIRENKALKGHIIPYLKERNYQVLSEQNIEQYETISFHLFLLGAHQDLDLVQDIRVKKFEQIKWLFAQYSHESGNISGKTEMNVWAKNEKILHQELDLYLDFYTELCETIIKLGVIHSVNLEERRIAFDLSSEIKSHTRAIFEGLKKRFGENPKVYTLQHTIGRSMVNFARWGMIIDGKTREEIEKQVFSVKKELQEGLDMMIASQFWGDPTKESIFCTVFLWEWTCIELIWLERIEKIYGSLNKDEEKRKGELLDNLLSIYNSWIGADIESSASAIDAFVTKDHLENEYQIETIYHIVCFDKSLDEMALGPLLYFLITKKEFPNALYEQFAIKIVEQIIKVLTKIGTEKMPEIHNYIDQTFLYLQGKNSSNFILGHSRIYTALARYYLEFADKTSIFLAQKAFLHYMNFSSVKEGDIIHMREEKEKQFYTLLWERYFESLWIIIQHSNEEKEKIGHDIFMKFSDKYQMDAIDTIKTKVIELTSTLSTGNDVYSTKEIKEFISEEIAEKLFDNLCTISIIGECKNCSYWTKLGESRPCKDDRTLCQSRKKKKWFQDDYIDMSNGLTIQFMYPVISSRIFRHIFVQKRDMIRDHFESLIASNTKNEKLTRLAFYDTDTSLPNRNKLEEDILGKERTIAFFEVADYSTILWLHWGRENWLKITKQIAEHFVRLSGITPYRYNEKVFCLVFSPESIERITHKGDASHVGKIIANIIEGIVFEFSTTYNRAIQFHTGIIVGQKEHQTKYAHIALTEAKNPRRHGPYIFKEGDEKKPEQAHYYTNILEKSLDDNNKEHVIVPYYQRVYDPKNPHKKNIEALARIEISSDTDAKKIVGAYSFIDIATNKKWLSKITRKMIEQIIEDMKQDPDLEVSINIHEQDWNDEGIMSWFRWIRENSGIETKRITIEILENVPLDRWDYFDANNKRIDGKDKKQIRELRKLGYKIAIDDYGKIGWSADKIKKVKPDKIKLDRSIIEGLKYEEDIKESIAIIRSTISMAREIGATITAEYVENKEIYEILLELWVDHFQWWYFAKAVPLNGVEWGEL